MHRTLPTLLVLTLGAASSANAAPEKFDSFRLSDHERATQVLRKYVGYVEGLKPEKHGAVTEVEITGFAVPVTDRLLACQMFVASGKKVWVTGPSARKKFRVVHRDEGRRIALLQSPVPLDALGLEIPPWAPSGSLKIGDEVVSLSSTKEDGIVSMGEISTLGDLAEYEGHPRVSMKLSHGAPVFDAYLRLIGVARRAAWDPDPLMIIPRKKIDAVVTAWKQQRESTSAKRQQAK